jgi:hypothetical protein
VSPGGTTDCQFLPDRNKVALSPGRTFKTAEFLIKENPQFNEY